MMPIATLVAHIRVWANLRGRNPFSRFLDVVAGWSDDQIADIVRFAKTTRGAEMAVAHVAKQKGY